jgi:hypothetical protein
MSVIFVWDWNDIPNHPSIFEWFLYDAQWFSQIFTDCHWLSRDFQWFIFIRAPIFILEKHNLHRWTLIRVNFIIIFLLSFSVFHCIQFLLYFIYLLFLPSIFRWNSDGEIRDHIISGFKSYYYYYYVFDLYSAFSTRFTNNQRRFQFIKMWYTHHSIFNVVLLKAIKNPVLCMLPPRALLTVLRRVQLGFETRASLPFFRAMT